MQGNMKLLFQIFAEKSFPFYSELWNVMLYEVTWRWALEFIDEASLTFL
jgi:hypothetical protein